MKRTRKTPTGRITPILGWAFGAEPVLHLTADEASLLGIILLPLADRAHKYVESGALTGRDAEVLANLADRLDVWFDGDDQQPQDLHESEEELVRACWRLRTGPQCWASARKSREFMLDYELD